MHRLAGLTYSEIARALGISVGRAHQLVHEALVYCIARLSDDR